MLFDAVLDAFLKTREEPIVDPLETIRKMNAVRKLGPLQRIEMERFAGTLLKALFWVDALGSRE
jgi:hypothetical protein